MMIESNVINFSERNSKEKKMRKTSTLRKPAKPEGKIACYTAASSAARRSSPSL